MHPSISIVIPVFNEKENIKPVIYFIEEILSVPYEVLVIYDFEQDNTLPVVKELIKKNKKIKLILNKKKGLINAIKLGFKQSKGLTVVVMSPDSADNPETISNMYEKIKSIEE